MDRTLAAVVLSALAFACGVPAEMDSEWGDTSLLPFAREVLTFSAGPGAGHGAEGMPDVVLGPPVGARLGAPATEVLSLGVEGQITLGFGGRTVVDGPGPDFVVFENAFHVRGDPTMPFAELGEVSVSEDGETFVAFDCQIDGDGTGRFPGCAGWSPTGAFDPFNPLDPEASGGDAFDLQSIGLQEVKFIRIRDLSSAGTAPTAGFDLDGVGLVHFRP